jgi:tRNA (mo5U34)-methyltransferase
MQQIYHSLQQAWPDNPGLKELCEKADQALANSPHGDLPRWMKALQQLPTTEQGMATDSTTPSFGGPAPAPAQLRDLLMSFHPWRKGPLQLAGMVIDTEWRSDWKWDRVSPHLELEGHRVLDIGCGNGYFGWRMLAQGAKLVVGVDPTLVFVMQWLACRHFAGEQANYVLPLRVEDLPPDAAGFDSVFSMGVLYHRRDPGQHLGQIFQLLRPGGTLVLETLILPGGFEQEVLIPENRYARMRNVWAIPSDKLLLDWVRAAGYKEVKLVDITPTSTEEQRSTPWMKFDSLQQALDPHDETRTVESYPAPTRALLVAQR